MKATLKYITIKTGTLKVNYVILHEGQFKTITEVFPNTVILRSFNKEGNDDCIVEGKEILNKVVKFLAVVNNTTYSIIHGNFQDIANYFNDNQELLQIFIDSKGSIEINGNVKHILTYPKLDDVVELTDIKLSELHGVHEDKLNRIGVIKEVNANKFNVDFRTFTQWLKRSQFNITTYNSKEVFELA